MFWLYNTIVVIVYFKIYCASCTSIFLAQNSYSEESNDKINEINEETESDINSEKNDK